MLKKMGIDEVLVLCVNDGAVMKAWAENQGVGADGEGSFITFLADPHGTFTDAMGLRMEHPGPQSIFGHGRSKRYSAYYDNGILKQLNVAEAPDDPAGDDAPENSLVEKMVEDLKNHGCSCD